MSSAAPTAKRDEEQRQNATARKACAARCRP
jgi:hypothetical protein